MKKIIGITMMFLSTSIFANNATVKNQETKMNQGPLDTCAVAITYYDSSGNEIGSEIKKSEQSSIWNCMAWQNGVIFDLRLQGYIVERTTDINP